MDELQWLRQQLDVEKRLRQIAEQQVVDLRLFLLRAHQYSSEAKEQQKVANSNNEKSYVAERNTVEIFAVNEVASVKCEVQTSSPRSPGMSTLYIWNGISLQVRHFQNQIDEGIRLILDKLPMYYTLDNDIGFEKKAEILVGGMVTSSGDEGDKEQHWQGRSSDFNSVVLFLTRIRLKSAGR